MPIMYDREGSFPKMKVKATRPLRQLNMDSFSSSVVSIEGYFHAVVIVNEFDGC